MRVALILLVACGGSPAHPVAPANRGGEDHAVPYELRLDTDGPVSTKLDSALPVDLLVVSKNPGVRVFIDGKAVGVTPLHASLPAGPHAIRAYREGY